MDRPLRSRTETAVEVGAGRANTVNGSAVIPNEFELASNTPMERVPAVASTCAGTTTFSCVGLTYVVGRKMGAQGIAIPAGCAVGLKFFPVRERLTSALPAWTDWGLNEEMEESTLLDVPVATSGGAFGLIATPSIRKISPLPSRPAGSVKVLNARPALPQRISFWNLPEIVPPDVDELPKSTMSSRA